MELKEKKSIKIIILVNDYFRYLLDGKVRNEKKAENLENFYFPAFKIHWPYFLHNLLCYIEIPLSTMIIFAIT